MTPWVHCSSHHLRETKSNPSVTIFYLFTYVHNFPIIDKRRDFRVGFREPQLLYESLNKEISTIYEVTLIYIIPLTMVKLTVL